MRMRMNIHMIQIVFCPRKQTLSGGALLLQIFCLRVSNGVEAAALTLRTKH